MGLLRWLKREPVVVEKIVEVPVEVLVQDPQAHLKVSLGVAPGTEPRRVVKSYLLLDELLLDPINRRSESYLIWAWLTGVEGDDLKTLAKDLAEDTFKAPVIDSPTLVYAGSRREEHQEHITSVKEFLENEPTFDTPKVEPTKSEVVDRTYVFPASVADDPFPYDRTAALSRGGILTPPRLGASQQKIYTLSQELEILGVKVKLPAPIVNVLKEQMKGVRRVVFDKNRNVVNEKPLKKSKSK